MIFKIEANLDLNALPAGNDQYIRVFVIETLGAGGEFKRVNRKEYRLLREKEAMGALFKVTIMND